MDDKETFVNSLEILCPELILIERVKTTDSTRGGIVMPQNVQERLTRSGGWAKVLKISDLPCEDKEVLERRERIKEGIYISFNAANPISCGNQHFPHIQRLAVHDIFETMTEENFKKCFEDEYTL